MSIYSECAGVSLQEVQARFEGKMYGAFKKELGEVVAAALEPLQNRYYEIRQTGEIHDILAKGAEQAQKKATQILDGVKDKMGFLAPK